MAIGGYEYNATANAILDSQTTFATIDVHNSGMDAFPSYKYGLALIIPVILGAMLVGLFITWFVFFLTTKQQQRSEIQVADVPIKRHEKMVSKLQHHKWNGTSMGRCQSNVTEETSSSDSATEPDSDPEEGQRQLHPKLSTVLEVPESLSFDSNAKSIFVEGSKELGCAICVQPFQVGQDVCESNNPDCRHVLHRTCTDKWLQFQNSCPICALPFVLNNTDIGQV